MAFKMKGSPAKMGGISGTAGHSSALKMRAEENAASALKQTATASSAAGTWDAWENIKATTKAAAEKAKTTKAKTTKSEAASKNKTDNDNWKKGQTKAKSEGGNLDALVKSRGGLKKGTSEYNKVQNKINSALGNKKRYDEGPAASETKVKPQTATSKSVKVKAEAVENLDKKTTKIAKNKARKDSGKKSIEFLEAKKANLEAKESDRQGSKGGKKQGFFRKLSSKINKNRQKKNQEKIDAKNETPAKKALVGNQKNLPEHLKAKIDAAPVKMYGKSMAKKYDK